MFLHLTKTLKKYKSTRVWWILFLQWHSWEWLILRRHRKEKSFYCNAVVRGEGLCREARKWFAQKSSVMCLRESWVLSSVHGRAVGPQRILGPLFCARKSCGISEKRKQEFENCKGGNTNTVFKLCWQRSYIMLCFKIPHVDIKH